MPRFIGPDFLHDTPPRIMGSETEFTVQSKRMRSLAKLRSLGRHTVFMDRHSYAWLDNGGLIYYDAAGVSAKSVLEYATPECSSATELALYEKAGEQIALEIAHEITGNSLDHPLYKRTAYCEVRGSDGKQILKETSIGHHENYASPLEHTLYAYDSLVSYLATRSIWAGAGIVTPTGYELSQRVRGSSFVNKKADYVHHGQKTVLHFRGDRLEIRAGDGNMIPAAIRTKYAMTSLVMRLVEHEVFPEEAIYLSGEAAQVAATAASRDPRELPMPGIPHAIAHQRIITDAALRFADTYDVPEEEKQAASDVHAILQALGTDLPLTVIADELTDHVDWAAKLALIRKQTGRPSWNAADFTTRHLGAVQHDLSYEAVEKDTPSAHLGQPLVPGEIDHAIMYPPRTRAKARTQYMQSLTPYVEFANWDEVGFANDMPSLELASPYYQYLDEQEEAW